MSTPGINQLGKRSREPEPEPEDPIDYLEIREASSAPLRTSSTTIFDQQAGPEAKILHLDTRSGEEHQTIAMICSLPGHAQNLRFSTYEEYEIHYNKTHLNRCLECRKNFPTNHFLNLHIEENHDALAAVRRERGEKTYVCFVEDCDKICSTPQKRRMHLIDKHYFPKDYDFYIVNNGIDNRSSMLRSGRHRRKSSAAQYAKESKGRHMDVSTGKPSKPEILEADKQNSNPEDSQESALPATAPSTQGDVYMDDLARAMSSLKFVPSSVKFGRGGARGGFSKR